MIEHRIHCQEPWFSLLRSGQKPVEGRKNSPLFQKIKVGDCIEFFEGEKSFKALVTGINKYSSVEEYLSTERLERALPGVASYAEGLAIYHAWNNPEDIAKWGFLGIQIKVKETK
jgi:ASC-1-like (ASCH) protein